MLRAEVEGVGFGGFGVSEDSPIGYLGIWAFECSFVACTRCNVPVAVSSSAFPFRLARNVQRGWTTIVKCAVGQC